MGLPKKVEIKNRKATFEYFFIDTYEAGLKLVGTEVKALREGNANLSDAYCVFKGDDLEVHSMYIGEYKFGNQNNHETRRVRRLLLKRSELKKLKRKVEEKGNTIVPYNLFHPDFDSVVDIISLAMSIEAQALDLYLRASEKAQNEAGKKALIQIANEEKVHLARLGQLMEETLT